MDIHFAENYPLKILLVEDMAITIRVMQAMLRSIGYEPLIARDGLEAVDLYTHEHPDFIIMDIQMPEMDGIEATKKIREINMQFGHKKSFITALTAATDTDHSADCFAAGMNEYLRKPVQKSHLCEIIALAYQGMA